MDEPTPSYDHEEASVSLKVVLLLFAVVLVGALAYMVMNQRNAVDETAVTASTMIVKKKSPTPKATLPPVSDFKVCSPQEAVLAGDFGEGKDWVALTSSQKAEIAAIKTDDSWVEYKGTGFSMTLPSDWKVTITDESAPPPSDKAYPGKRYRMDFGGHSMRVYDLNSFAINLNEIKNLVNPQLAASTTVKITDASINSIPTTIACSNFKLTTGEVIGNSKEYVIKTKENIYATGYLDGDGSILNYNYLNKKTGIDIAFGAAKNARKFQLGIESFKLIN